MIVVIEGGDQAGKLTQSTMLQKALKKSKIKTKLFHFPDYTTPIGKQIRAYLDGKTKFSPQVIHCLLAANRWERLEAINQAQAKYAVVIMNRYYQSNLVYGIANKMNPKWLENLDNGLPKADLVILLDVSQSESFQRQSTRRDRFEKDVKFQRNISNIYKKTAKQRRWKIIDATKSKDQIHKEILKTLFKKMKL